MDLKLAAAALLVCLTLAGCGGGMQVGGPDSQLGPNAATLSEDNPYDNNTINEGTGDVMQ